MTALADLSQLVEIPEAGIADKAITTDLTAFDTQALYGSGANIGFFSQPHHVQSSAGVFLDLTYTPPVDAWWDVRAHMGYVHKGETTNHYAYLYLVCTPAPAVLGQTRYCIAEQKLDSLYPNTDRVCQSLFGLSAGIAYTVAAWIGQGNGGTWRYWYSYNQIHGKAWAR